MIHILSKRRTLFIYIALGLVIAIGLYFRLIYALDVEFAGLYQRTGFTREEYGFIRMVDRLLSYYTFGYYETHDAAVMPGYPIFLAMIMVIFGTEDAGVQAVRILQALISAGTIYLIFLLAAKMLDNRGAGLIAALLVALYPPLILYSRFILSETLYIFFITFYFLIQLRALEKRESAYHIGAGILLGVAVLFRPMIFFLLPLPYIVKIITAENHEMRKSLIRNSIFFAIACCVILVPWWFRNMVTLERFVLLAEFGELFYTGIIRDYSLLPATDAPIADGMRLLILELWHRPLETLIWFTFGKLDILLVQPSFFLPYGFTLLSSLTMPLHMYIVALGSIGLLGGLIHRKTCLMSVFICFYIILSLLFIPIPRYGLQYMPFLAIFTVFALFKVFSKTRIIVERGEQKEES